MITKERLEWLKEHKCQESRCYNYRLNGYAYCIGHLYGFPRRMEDNEIEALKKETDEKCLNIK